MRFNKNGLFDWSIHQFGENITGCLLFGENISNNRHPKYKTQALFSSQIFWFLATVTLSFFFDKHCLIME